MRNKFRANVYAINEEESVRITCSWSDAEALPLYSIEHWQKPRTYRKLFTTYTTRGIFQVWYETTDLGKVKRWIEHYNMKKIMKKIEREHERESS